MKNKNSAVDLTDLALGIVVLGIVVSVGAVILGTMKQAQVTNLATYSVNGETVTPLTSGTNLATTWGKTVDFCQNLTGPAISSGNYTYTIDASTGTISLKNLTSEFAAAAWKCNYTVYNVSDPRFAVPNKAELGLAEYGNWFKIIVIVGVAAVILSLIFMAFGKSTGSSEIGGSY
jgi:hypothetical protein